MAVEIAFLDASVLYPAPLRDVLLELAVSDLYRAKWSARVHDEWTRALLRSRPDITAARLERTRRLMDTHVSDVLVTGFEDLVPSLELPDPGDRHVLAAAIRAEADIIVTANLKDFPASSLGPHGLEAEHPDAFLARLCGRWPARFVEALHRVRGRLHHPPLSRDEHLRALRRSGLRATVEEVVARTVSLPPPGAKEEETP